MSADAKEAWRLVMIVDDIPALKVAAAYYALPRNRRDDLAKISAGAGISQDVSTILTRLELAGMLGHKDPPAVLVNLINAHCAETITKATAGRR